MYPIKLNDINGFSLIELVVAIFVTMIVVGGATTAFIIQNRASSVQQGTSDMQLSGQVAVEFVERDIRMAGYHVDKSIALTLSDNAPSSDLFRIERTDAIFVNYSTFQYEYYIEDQDKVPARQGGLIRRNVVTGDRETIASNVEDMQVDGLPYAGTGVPSVTVRLLIRSPFIDPSFTSQPTYDGLVADVAKFPNCRRRVYQTTISPRNFGW